MDDGVTKLTVEIRNALGRHMLRFNEDQYKEMIGIATIALAFEVAWFRHFVVCGKEVTGKTFDKIFGEKVLKYYEECLRQES